jgi:hypothetical protein
MFGEAAAEGAVLRDVGRGGIGEVVAGGRTVGYGVSVAAPLRKGDAIADYYARIAGMDLSLNQSISREYLRAQYRIQRPAAPFEEWIKTQRPRIILGARLREEANILGRRILLSGRQQRALAKIETAANLARARAAVTAGRLNVLLSRPFDLPVIGPALSKIPGANRLAVKPGTSLQMARRFAAKGALLGLGWKGLEYYDYLRASGSAAALPFGAAAGAAVGGFMFRGAGRMFSPAGLAIGALAGAATAILPRFDEGLFYGLASIPADINIARARASEATGLSESLREQEDLTPGLISPKTALGFAGVGALAAGMYKYSTFLGKAAQERVAKGGALADIFKTIRSAEAEKIGKLWTETALGKKIAGLPKVGKYISKIKHPMALGALAGFGAWLGLSTGLSLASGNVMAALPGVNLLGTAEDPEELEAIYSGEQEVPVRKGRFWEFGRSSYEGERIQYYRQHALARMRNRAYQKGIWESEEERWAHDPVLNPLKALFGSDEWKYYYEQKYQYERPAPLTSTFGGDVPFIGPLVAATVGKALKPRKFVRPEEWMTPEGVVPYEEKPELAPAYELGGLGPGMPVLPEDPTQVANELIYRRREAVGLPGFVAGAVQKSLTGREEYFQNLQTLGTMGDETGSEYWLWKHMNVGGAAGTSEVVRRFIPRTRSYLETYNPLEWNAPSWFPKDYFIDLRRGNIFKDIPEAEVRLPGPGYAARFPELEGVDPNQYPLIHRLKILSDIAMWSDEYKATLAKANAASSQMSDYELDMLQTIKQQVRAKKKRREFTPYRFTEDLKPVSPEIEEKYSATERAVGGLWEKIAHQAQTPLEYLTPMSPASKLIGQRSAIEEYIATEAVGTKSSFWDRPIENFLSPAAEMMEYKFGDKTIAETHQQRRDIEKHFDMLEWVKNYRLEKEARTRRDWQAAKEYEEAKKKTLFGTNPFGNPVMAMAAMPRRERDFFSAFAGAETEEARREILNLVPEQVGRIYAARWASDELADIRDRKEEGIATKEDEKREDVLYAFRRTQGYAAEDVDELEEQWLEETGGEIPFAEWIRLKRAQKYFATHSLPGADWLGFHSSVDLEDIKLKYVEAAGLDYHDFDLWDDRERMLSRKPYIDSELLEQMNTRAALEDVLKLDKQASSFGKQLKAARTSSRLHIVNGDIGNRYDIEVADSREGLVNGAFKELGA